jgi:prepilin-type N-terminal cleavage/methylation domain-containing protein
MKIVWISSQKKNTFKKNGMIFSVRSGFTIIELMVAILIFTFWLLSAYMLVDSAMWAAINGRNEIITANLAREQLELVKNLRDTNWLQNLNFISTGALNATAANQNQRNLDVEPLNFTEFGSWYYIIENRDWWDNEATIYLKKLDTFSWNQWQKPDISKIKLCLKNWRYVHDCASSDATQFYSFIQIEKLNIGEETNTAFRLTSVVITMQRTYREYVVRTIITDWKR